MNKTTDRGGSRTRVLVPFAYMALIFVLSSIPGTSGPDDFSIQRPDTWLSSPIQNALHIPTYGLLVFLLWWSLIPWTRSARLQAAAALLIAAAYGVLDELHQLAVPGRTSSMTDVVFNLVGVVAGGWLFGRVSGRLAGPPRESDLAGES